VIVEVKNLVKRYNDFLALDHINLSIGEGQIFGLLGPNGAGKTTTISTISGMTRQDGGEVRILGLNLKTHEREIKRQIGIVPQELAVFEDLSAYENLQYFGRLYGLRGSVLKERVEQALEFTGLLERCKDTPKKYSGGMKRRLNIACAIVHRPKLIIMDEPTVGIDPQSRNHILQSIRTLNEQGATIVYTSHYMEEVEELCSDIVIIDHGRVIAKGTKDELKALVATEEKLELELTSVNYTLLEELKSLQGVKHCELEGKRLTVISQKNSGNLNRIIERITALDSEVASLSFAKPNLESVFLTLTGRSLRD